MPAQAALTFEMGSKKRVRGDGRYLRGHFLGQADQKSVVTPPNDRQFRHISTTRVATAGADIEISWAATREFDGGPSYGVAFAGLLGGSALTTGLTVFIGFLVRRTSRGASAGEPDP